MSLRTLLIDNYDSYTFNLFQYIAEINGGTPPDVLRNDSLPWPVLRQRLGLDPSSPPEARLYDNVVISPGPGVPSKPQDFGVCEPLLREANGELPVLGVCLGHQGLALSAGRGVVLAREVAHGVVTPVRHNGTDSLFEGVPSRFNVVRYHSWIVQSKPAKEGEKGVEEAEEDDIEEIAWTATNNSTEGDCDKANEKSKEEGEEEESVVMAIKHKRKPLWGVQFHPESVCTEYGKVILRNFHNLSLELTQERRKRRMPIDTKTVSPQECDDCCFGQHDKEENQSLATTPQPFSVLPSFRIAGMEQSKCERYRLHWRRVYSDDTASCTLFLDSETVFMRMLDNSKEETGQNTVRAFWLDSSRVEQGRSRFSFMGVPAFHLFYNVHAKQVTIQAGKEKRIETLAAEDSFFDYMQRELSNRYCRHDDSLPFNFQCGFTGYFGYEMRLECGSCEVAQSSLPDAAFMFADKMLAFDHELKVVYLLALEDITSSSQHDDQDWKMWLTQTEQLLRKFVADSDQRKLDDIAAILPASSNDGSSSDKTISFRLARDHSTYINNIQHCLQQIRDGESYEICLTNKVKVEGVTEPDSILFYRTLRRVNAAPYGAFFLFPGYAICSSSPERFMTISSKGDVESKPIKGTMPRGQTEEEDRMLAKTLRESKKDFSENLMIVDLIRNDIGKVCEIGSVHVPLLMDVESYATVHQLVSTVRGKLRKDQSSLECLRHAFPPGSMTGAPKLRSMDIIHSLEREAREVYSGTLGFIALNGRSCDMSVVIRTAVILNEEDEKSKKENGGAMISIGCGGAIVAASDKQSEFDEMLLKAKALLHSFLLSTTASSPEEITVQGAPEKLKLPAARSSMVASSIERKDPDWGAKFLQGLSFRGMDLSLDRIKLLLKHIGQPQHSYPIIHVTGTNGKGSVCCLLSTILCKAGYKVGRFTSPHLVRWTECISVDDNDISPHSLSHAVSVIADAMHRFNISLTQFEALTAAAYYHFHKEQVEVGVIEVGMGGRLDATNVTDSCLLAIITSIGLDHVNVLGKTKVDIAKQKMGIIKPGCHAILACSLPPEVVLVISQYATSMNSHVVIAQTFDTNGDELSLKGEHQRINFGTVMAAIDVLRNSGWDRLANRAIIAEALKSVKWVARLQCICWKGREVWIDGGHNTDAGFFVGRFARSLLRTRNEQATHIHWIIGMLSHKDHIGFLRALLTEQEENDSSYSYSSSNSVEQVCQTTTFVPVTANVGWLRGESPQALAKLALNGCSAAIDTVDVQLSVTDALDSAVREDEKAIIMVTGSLVCLPIQRSYCLIAHLPFFPLSISAERYWPVLNRKKTTFSLHL
ncbi:aminodeoxychorismate synthase, variant 2 [Balamuthia mandrillaris]